METDAEKRNLGQIAIPSFVGVPNRLKFYTHLDRVNHTLWVQIFFFARGRARGAAPPCKSLGHRLYLRNYHS